METRPIATLRITGKKYKQFNLSLPATMVKSLVEQGVNMEHLDQFYVNIDPVGKKATPKPYAFKIGNKTISYESIREEMLSPAKAEGPITDKQFEESFQYKSEQLSDLERQFVDNYPSAPEEIQGEMREKANNTFGPQRTAFLIKTFCR